MREKCFLWCIFVLFLISACSEVKEIPRERGSVEVDDTTVSGGEEGGNFPDETGDILEERDIGFYDISDVIIAGDISEDYGAKDTGKERDGGYPDAGICPSSISERFSVRNLDISPDSVNTMGGMYFSYYTPPLIKPFGDGYLLAYLSYDGKVRIMGLDRNFDFKGIDISIEANELRGLAVSGSGFAVLIQRGTDEMAIAGFDGGGTQKFDTTIVGKTDHNVAWAKYIKREWGDYGTLGYYNNQYVAYFGHSMNWGESGEHQGDLLWFFDIDGKHNGGMWDWGCSHSLDVRLAYNTQRLGAVCLSDCYPEKAICFNHRESVIHNEPSGNCAGRSNAVLGGLVAFEDGFYHTFISSEGRQSPDIALVKISNDSSVSNPVWITDTPDISEDNTHLAKYGENLFVVYRVDNLVKAGIISKNGNSVSEFEVINNAEFNQQTNLENDLDGNVLWVFGEGSLINIYIVRYCN